MSSLTFRSQTKKKKHLPHKKNNIYFLYIKFFFLNLSSMSATVNNDSTEILSPLIQLQAAQMSISLSSFQAAKIFQKNMSNSGTFTETGTSFAPKKVSQPVNLEMSTSSNLLFRQIP